MKAVKNHILCPNTDCRDDYFIITKLDASDPLFCPLCGESINIHDDSYEEGKCDEEE